jgi:hypothetical protein
MAVLMADAVAPGLAAPPWRSAYTALKDRRLDRITRHFGWRLLHEALRCGAASLHWCAADSEQAWGWRCAVGGRSVLQRLPCRMAGWCQLWLTSCTPSCTALLHALLFSGRLCGVRARIAP